MKNSFQDKVALITGATSGIGAATAKTLAARSAKVIVSGRRQPEGQAVVKAIQAAGGSAAFCKADTSKEADVQALVAFTLKTFGRLDYAFNNAGIEGVAGLTTDKQTEENYRQTFDINVLGVLLSMKHEIPAMLKNGGGAIVNTSSVAGHIGMGGVGVYVASKHAVEGLTKSAALEFSKQGVRVNAVAPAAIQTDMMDRFIGESKTNNPQRDWLTNAHPIGRIGTTDEVALAVISLFENPFITGTSLAVDGGFMAQ